MLREPLSLAQGLLDLVVYGCSFWSLNCEMPSPLWSVNCELVLHP